MNVDPMSDMEVLNVNFSQEDIEAALKAWVWNKTSVGGDGSRAKFTSEVRFSRVPNTGEYTANVRVATLRDLGHPEVIVPVANIPTAALPTMDAA